jgi:probable HAF family extracellular repeat protein
MNRKALSLSLGIALLACLPLSAQTTYSFKDVNYPGDTFTQFLGINNSDVVAGYHGASINKGFTYDNASSTFTSENFPGSTQTQVTGINNPPSKTVGFWIDKTNHVRGFTDFENNFVQVVDTMGAFNQLLGQNDHGQAVGYYSRTVNNSTPDFPYIYDEFGGIFEVISIPAAVGGAQATGINNSSDVVGFFIDKGMVNHGWLLEQGNFTVLDYPESTFTQALGINNKGVVVGTFIDSSNAQHGFTYTISSKTWQQIDDPNGVGTTVTNGINDKGMLVGFWGTAPLNTAFVATP